jgi:hypothetical protein
LPIAHATFRPAALHDDLASAMFDQLEAWAGALKPLRAGGSEIASSK